MAEEARRRVKLLEQRKKGEEVLSSAEEKRRLAESQALARLRSQHPVSLFNPTLAYALKVESSKGKRPVIKGEGEEKSAHGGEEEKASTNSSEEATSAPSGASSSHIRKPSLYDGSDWDELKHLSSSASAADKPDSIDESNADGGEEEDQVDELEEGEDADDQEESEEINTKPVLRVQSLSTALKSKPSKPPSSTEGSSSRRAHARTLSTVAREHIASQMEKIQTKETKATQQIQARRKKEKAQRQQLHQAKALKSDSIRLAREAELLRMQRAMDVQIADESERVKVQNYVLAMKLAKAAKDGDCEKIRALSLDSSETLGDVVQWVNRHDSAGSTAIFHAAWTAAVPALELLFSLGAEANITNNRKNTALHLACDRRHYPAISVLIRCGANPLLKNHERCAPYEMQAKESNESLEMALFLRQCLEDTILEKGDPDETGEDARQQSIGNGMANVAVQQQEVTAANGESPSPATTPAVDQVTPPTGVSRTTSPAIPEDRPKTSRITTGKRKTAVAALDDAVIVSNARTFLAGINSYITARIQVLQSIRRTKLKIWTAVRFRRGSAAVPRVTEEETGATTNGPAVTSVAEDRNQQASN